MNSALRFIVGLLGGALLVVLFASFLLIRSTRDLPADLTALSGWASPQASRILDREGLERARFRLVERSTYPPGGHDELVEAFLSAAPGSFYEPRSDAATSLGSALRRVMRGEGPPASPLSTALARLLLSSEAPGAIRRLREDLVSTWLDAAVPISARVVAWLDRVPLCLGRRGLAQAAQVCLGRALGELSTGDRVTLAAAAAWQLDLAGDRDELEARRAQVLDRLVGQARLEASEAAGFGAAGVSVPRPSGADAWAEIVALEPRHHLGRNNERRPVSVRTELDWSLQEPLMRTLPPGGAFVVLRPGTGAVLAMGGDLLGPVRGEQGPTPLDLAAWAGGLVTAARLSGALPAETTPGRLRWASLVTVGDGVAEEAWQGRRLRPPGVHPQLAGDPAQLLGVRSLSGLPLRQHLRWVELDGASVALHEELVFVYVGGGAAEATEAARLLGELARGAAFSRPERYSWSGSVDEPPALPQSAPPAAQ